MSALPVSLKIGVLRGGPSSEYETSLKTGANVLENLSQSYKTIDIFISEDGVWHMSGMAKTPEKILKQVDVIFNALHGTWGEDGGVQKILSSHGVPFTGSDILPSAISMNKLHTKERLKKIGIKTPVYSVVRRTDDLSKKTREIWNSIPHPLIIKPANGGSAQKNFKADSYQELLNAIENVLADYDMALIEECISGKSVSCLVTENFRGEKMYAFPPHPQISQNENLEVQDLSKKIHDSLELSHYSQSDFIVSPRRGVYFLEINSLPKLHKESVSNISLASVGVSTKEFIHHLLNLALGKTQTQ